MTDQPLLDAMLRMLQRYKVLAVAVTGYTEASYNIGYCGTCSETVTSVRIFYRRADGTDAHWDAEYGDLGELIRELTKDPDEQAAFDAVAIREDDELKWERSARAHRMDEAVAITEVPD